MRRSGARGDERACDEEGAEADAKLSREEFDPNWALDRTGQCFEPLALISHPSSAAEQSSAAPSPVWVSETIRRIAWGGDRQRGTARVELGAGPYAGSALQVEVNSGMLRVELMAPPGVDANGLAERLEARLEQRGLRIASLRVR